MMYRAKRVFFYLTFFMGTFSLPLGIQAADATVSPLQALSIYPADVRAAIAAVLQRPDVLLDLEKYRKVARAQFGELLALYPQKTQETVKQLVPYRRLWRGLGAYQGSEQDTQQLLKSYPKDVRDLANYLLKNSPDILGKVVRLEKETYQHFFSMISGLDPQTQADFKKVGQHSGILSILSDALNLGSEGKAPSAELKQKSQDLANQLLALNKDGRPKKTSASSNPSEASATLDAASQKFNDRLNSQLDQDPYSDDAVEATVTYSHNGSYNSPLGGPYHPYWY